MKFNLRFFSTGNFTLDTQRLFCGMRDRIKCDFLNVARNLHFRGCEAGLCDSICGQTRFNRATFFIKSEGQIKNRAKKCRAYSKLGVTLNNMPYHFGPQRCNKFARRNAQKFAFIVAGFQKGSSWPLPLSFNTQFRDIFVFFFQTRTISVVSEETKKQLEQMLDQNKELEAILAKTRSDYDAKVGITDVKLLSAEFVENKS